MTAFSHENNIFCILLCLLPLSLLFQLSFHHNIMTISHAYRCAYMDKFSFYREKEEKGKKCMLFTDSIAEEAQKNEKVKRLLFGSSFKRSSLIVHNTYYILKSFTYHTNTHTYKHKNVIAFLLILFVEKIGA